MTWIPLIEALGRLAFGRQLGWDSAKLSGLSKESEILKTETIITGYVEPPPYKFDKRRNVRRLCETRYFGLPYDEFYAELRKAAVKILDRAAQGEIVLWGVWSGSGEGHKLSRTDIHSLYAGAFRPGYAVSNRNAPARCRSARFGSTQ